MAPSLRLEGEPPPDYGIDNDKFTVEVHHCGFFVGQDSDRAYIDGKVNWFDHCEVETWSPLWFLDFADDLRCPSIIALKIYWLLPGKSLAEGLRVIESDSDTQVMSSVADRVKNFIVYFDHNDSFAGINWEDIVANPIASLPKVMSPAKGGYFGKDEREQVPPFEMDQNSGQHDVQGDESSDDDADFNDSDYDIEGDDADFMHYVDQDITEEKIASKRQHIVKSKKAVDSKLKGKKVSSKAVYGAESTDESELELPESDEEGQGFRFKTFRDEDLENPIFKVGMVFQSVQMLRKAITEYSLLHRVDIKMPRNEKKRLRAHCDDDCPWSLYASNDSRSMDDESLMIKTYNGHHTCHRKWSLKNCTSTWLSQKYLESFRADQKMSLTNFARTVQKEWNLTPPRTTLARARRIAMRIIHGDEEEQYNLLWDYAHEMRRSNPGSTFFLNLSGNLFSSLYVSLDACKRGFLAGCRPIICLDGCHLKTKHGGIMLTAVGIDPNDCIYPIAFGVVEVESLATWKWFLEALKTDLGIENTFPWTVMTDKQKGLVPAVAQVFLESEHRFCVRHLYSNFQMHFKGENLKNQLWMCARSTTEVKWNENMEKMKVLNQKAFEWLEKMPPSTWVRAFFSTFSKCDILLNNSCEVFNNYILEAREMPILSMLEQIKTQLMTRYHTKENEVGNVWDGPICPKIRKKLHKISQWANTCYPQPAGNAIFEVNVVDRKYIVDLRNKKCDCRRWELTGIPCSHAISCLRMERIVPESMVHECYSSEMYLKAYAPQIYPCNDKSMWKKVQGPQVLPPVYEKKVGRPPKKNRRKEPHEVMGKFGPKMSKHGTVITCSYCGIEGHNRAGCKLRKAGIMPEQQNERNPNVNHGHGGLADGYEEPVTNQASMRIGEGSQPPLSQMTGTLLSQLHANCSQTSNSQLRQEPLPDSTFITINRPATRPVPPTTATKAGRARLKRTAPTGSSNQQGNTKKATATKTRRPEDL